VTAVRLLLPLALNIMIFLHIKIFCTAKSFKALQKLAKMPETTRNFGSEGHIFRKYVAFQVLAMNLLRRNVVQNAVKAPMSRNAWVLCVFLCFV
jgi:hypothetical protein